MKKVLKRSDYLNLINDIIDTPYNSIDDFLQAMEDEYLPNNQALYDNLYKDINYILAKYDKRGDGDLLIENGDFVIERGDFKLTGKQTTLHPASRWCWMKITARIAETKFHPSIQAKYPAPFMFMERMDTYIKELDIDDYSPDYKKELNKIADKLNRYRDGKTSHFNLKDVPVWLKITGAIITSLVGITTLISFIFKPEASSILDFLNSFF